LEVVNGGSLDGSIEEKRRSLHSLTHKESKYGKHGNTSMAE
jgi:hypothetical protein